MSGMVNRGQSLLSAEEAGEMLGKTTAWGDARSRAGSIRTVRRDRVYLNCGASNGEVEGVARESGSIRRGFRVDECLSDAGTHRARDQEVDMERKAIRRALVLRRGSKMGLEVSQA